MQKVSDINAHYSVLDYFGFGPGGKLVGVFEIKCRNVIWGAYPVDETILLSAGKWNACVEYSRNLGVPFYLVVSCFSGTYEYKADIADVESGKIFCLWGGRTDKTRDKGDVEPVMHIPIGLFAKVSDENAFGTKE
jgi:hypothetical protein